jgi:hypothetical protein
VQYGTSGLGFPKAQSILPLDQDLQFQNQDLFDQTNLLLYQSLVSTLSLDSGEVDTTKSLFQCDTPPQCFSSFLEAMQGANYQMSNLHVRVTRADSLLYAKCDNAANTDTVGLTSNSIQVTNFALHIPRIQFKTGPQQKIAVIRASKVLVPWLRKQITEQTLPVPANPIEGGEFHFEDLSSVSMVNLYHYIFRQMSTADAADAAYSVRPQMNWLHMPIAWNQEQRSGDPRDNSAKDPRPYYWRVTSHDVAMPPQDGLTDYDGYLERPLRAVSGFMTAWWRHLNLKHLFRSFKRTVNGFAPDYNSPWGYDEWIERAPCLAMSLTTALQELHGRHWQMSNRPLKLRSHIKYRLGPVAIRPQVVRTVVEREVQTELTEIGMSGYYGAENAGE